MHTAYNTLLLPPIHLYALSDITESTYLVTMPRVQGPGGKSMGKRRQNWAKAERCRRCLHLIYPRQRRDLLVFTIRSSTSHHFASFLKLTFKTDYINVYPSTSYPSLAHQHTIVHPSPPMESLHRRISQYGHYVLVCIMLALVASTIATIHREIRATFMSWAHPQWNRKYKKTHSSVHYRLHNENLHPFTSTDIVSLHYHEE